MIRLTRRSFTALVGATLLTPATPAVALLDHGARTHIAGERQLFVGYVDSDYL